MKPGLQKPEMRDTRGYIMAAGSLAIIAIVYLRFDAFPQPQSYYQFADTRTIFGIANFWNVISNLTFLLPGFLGLKFLRTARSGCVLHGTRTIYLVLYVGIVLTAAGSAWFHLSPDNDTLVWDRLPMTIVFMSLTAAIVSEHISVPLGRRLFLPLIAIGVASVFYWAHTESLGHGDLRPYGLVQFLPVLLVPAIAITYNSAFDQRSYLFVMFAIYAVAKVFEHFDHTIYAFGQVVSGHTLKHIVAALVPLALLQGLRKRQMKSP